MKDKNERISVLIHTAIGILAGVASDYIGSTIYALALAVAILLVTGKGTEFVAKGEGLKWWAGNGIVPYVFMWLITWILLLNL